MQLDAPLAAYPFARRSSGGQRQGVAIARAVNWGSDLVLLDEPTAALGVTETSKVEDVINELRNRGLTQIIVSHNLDQVFRLSDRIAVMRRGELVSILKTKDTNPESVIGFITGVLSDAENPHG
mgnify:CR=1 FL=1